MAPERRHVALRKLLEHSARGCDFRTLSFCCSSFLHMRFPFLPHGGRIRASAGKHAIADNDNNNNAATWLTMYN